MPEFTLRTINSRFFTETDATNYPTADDAVQQGVRGALMIAADEAFAGVCASVVEVIVEDYSGRQVRRLAVSVSVAPLAVGAVEQRPALTPINDR